MDRCDQSAALSLSQEFARRCAFVVLMLAPLVVATPVVAQQAPVPEVSFPIVVSTDAGDEEGLTFGYDPNAADSNIDEQFLEEQQPPLPPSEIFDVRLIDDDVPPSGFGEGLLSDIRQGGLNFSGTKRHEIQLQPGDGVSSVTFEWHLPAGVTGTLKDVVTDGDQVNVSMEGHGSHTLTNLNITELFVTFDYDGSQSSINIQSLFVDSDGSCGNDGTCDFTNTGVDVDFPGVSTSGAVTLTKFRNAPGGTDGISESNVSAYRYVVESDELSFSDITLRLADSTLAGMTTPNSVQVYRRDSPESGTFESVATNASSDGTEVVATTGALGEFVLASNTEPLPVELTQFTVRRDEERALVQWRTATETNNAGFEVQHQGPNAEDYVEVGYVESKGSGGTTTESTSYRYEVSSLIPGTHQFRLRQVDIDGTARLSETVSLTVGTDQPLQLSEPSPNPVRAGTQIRFSVQNPGSVTVELYNVLGQRVATVYEGTAAPEKVQTIRLRPQGLAGVSSGIYFVRLKANGATQTRRVTVVR